PACWGKEVGFAGQALDSDWELRIAEFDLIVGVFRRPHVDSERDSGDEYEDRDESLHGETPLWEIVILPLVWRHSPTSCQISSAHGRPESSKKRPIAAARAANATISPQARIREPGHRPKSACAVDLIVIPAALNVANSPALTPGAEELCMAGNN